VLISDLSIKGSSRLFIRRADFFSGVTESMGACPKGKKGEK